jgi:Bacteriophage tail sheath protein
VPVTPTFPGVYIEEVPSGVHPITGVATSIAAFVDFFQRGPMNEAVEIFSFADFERVFGGLDSDSEASYAIQQFFLNGGTHAWVVRVATAGGGGNTATKASVQAARETSATQALTFTAANEGLWGNNLRVRVDWATSDPTTLFNLTVAEVLIRDNRAVVVSSEEFRELSMDSTSTRYAQTIVDAGSTLITLTTNGSPLPAPSGAMTTADFAAVGGSGEKLVKVRFTYNDGGSPAFEEFDDVSLGTGPIATIDDAAGRLEAAIRSANPIDPAWAGATVRVMGNRIQVLPGLARPATVATFAAATSDGATAGALSLPGGGAEANVTSYALGATVNQAKQLAGVKGLDGIPPKGTDLIGSGAATPPTGMHALDKVDLFNILCLPRIARVDGVTDPFPSADVSSALTNAINYCESRQAFFVVDTPSDVNNVIEFKAWLASTLDAVRNKNAAVYFPRTVSGDPLDDFRPRTFGASGTIAGLYSRIDATRGVWKAPAGTEATLANVQKFDYKLNDPENGVLNPLGINCLRVFDVYGNVCWGARTLDGADAKASEWKYVPVRRFALFLEESLLRGTKWVVFEPNDEPLWAQIRLNVGAFMHNLFRQGAFQGMTPRDAYFVKCDGETTNQTDVNNGVVNILVGFAPLKPAEFVIIRIQQLAGQIET